MRYLVATAKDTDGNIYKRYLYNLACETMGVEGDDMDMNSHIEYFKQAVKDSLKSANKTFFIHYEMMLFKDIKKGIDNYVEALTWIEPPYNHFRSFHKDANPDPKGQSSIPYGMEDLFGNKRKKTKPPHRRSYL